MQERQYETPYHNVGGVAVLKVELLLKVYNYALEHTQDLLQVEKYQGIIVKVIELYYSDEVVSTISN